MDLDAGVAVDVRTAVDLGAVIRGFREHAELTRAAAAAQVEVSPRYLWELESGKPKLLLERVFALSELLGFDLVAVPAGCVVTVAADPVAPVPEAQR